MCMYIYMYVCIYIYMHIYILRSCAARTYGPNSVARNTGQKSKCPQIATTNKLFVTDFRCVAPQTKAAPQMHGSTP